MDEDWAGSCPIAVNTSGIAAPKMAAITIDRIIDIPMTPASPVDPLQTHTPSDVVAAMAAPFQNQADISLKTTRGQ
jgi:hypothetical protein